ncbi:MAG: DNA mismatch repair endonuclease MutL [Christensenellaceae bacterium]
MAKINILPAVVFNRIAAGEVVDRPYSVVKELVENSIDAGAKNIDISIEKGGKASVTVTDDGSGIEREDLRSAFLPHATSKIATAEDLERIMTLGFRGEALASISAVAQVSITSRTEGNSAWRITCNGGEIGEITEDSGGKGTTIAVENLFYHTPARLKFLKTDKAEEGDVTALVARFILGHPEVAFTYYADGRKIYQSFGGGLEEAMTAVYDLKTLSSCIRIDAEKHGVRICGYIGNQNYFKANRSYQSTFVNGRYVTNNTLQMALHNAYGSYMMKRQYPFYVLYLTIPPEVVDVNVHPNKADVRFQNNQIIYGIVYSVISSVLDGKADALDFIVHEAQVLSTASDDSIRDKFVRSDVIAPITQSNGVSEKRETEPFHVKPVSDIADSSEEEGEGKDAAVASADSAMPVKDPVAQREAPRRSVQPAYTFTYEQAKEEVERTRPKIELPFPEREPIRTEVRSRPYAVPTPSFTDALLSGARKEGESEEESRPIKEEDPYEENKRFLAELEQKQKGIEIKECVFCGVLFQTYLLYERGEEVYLIDQHAAHERLIFDELKRKMESRSVTVQPMLLPYLLQANPGESEFLMANLDNIRAIGFEIDEFGTGCFRVSAIPTDLQDIRLDEFFADILSDISGLKSIRLVDLLKDKLAMAACKAAVKGGMKLTEQEADALFAKMDGNMGLKCPHGRPVVVRLTKTEIEKMFKRIV